MEFLQTSRRAGKTDTINMQDDEKDTKQREDKDSTQWRVPVIPEKESQYWEDRAWNELMTAQLNERVYLESIRNRKATDKYDQAVRDTPSGKCMIHDRKNKKFDLDFACKFCCEKQKSNPEWLCYWLDEKMCAKMLPSAKQITDQIGYGNHVPTYAKYIREKREPFLIISYAYDATKLLDPQVF